MSQALWKARSENYCQGVTPAVMKCRHVEFPNSSCCRLQLCQVPLSQQVKSLDGSITNWPELIYPFSGIKNQLTTMFRRPGFESSLRHWANRSNFDNILTDIYNGKVWKTFKDDDLTIFFRGEVADSHRWTLIGFSHTMVQYIVQERYMQPFVIYHVIFDFGVKICYFSVYYLGRTK